jgi:hypothetical protein
MEPSYGPIVYWLAWLSFKERDRVRFPVGLRCKICLMNVPLNKEHRRGAVSDRRLFTARAECALQSITCRPGEIHNIGGTLRRQIRRYGEMESQETHNLLFPGQYRVPLLLGCR